MGIELNMDTLWLQQDGATCYTSKDTVVLLRKKFPYRLISAYLGDQCWPPWSCNLILCNFFLWRYVKLKFYENKPPDLTQLKQEIRRVMGELNSEICECVIKTFMGRSVVCRIGREGHMPNIVFYT